MGCGGRAWSRWSVDLCARPDKGKIVSDYVLIRPRDDKAARQASDWCNDLDVRLRSAGHSKLNDIDDTGPPDTPTITSALASHCDLVCYFGHGRESAWTTGNVDTIDNATAVSWGGKAIVSVACKTACLLGPDAITAGA